MIAPINAAPRQPIDVSEPMLSSAVSKTNTTETSMIVMYSLKRRMSPMPGRSIFAMTMPMIVTARSPASACIRFDSS